MHRLIFTLALTGLLGFPAQAHAQQATLEQAPAHADILYLYRMQPARKATELNPIQELVDAMVDQHPAIHIQLFGDIRYPHDYVAVIQGQYANQVSATGWSTSLLKRYSSNFPAGRSFVLDSTLLIGDAELKVNPSSFVQIEHVDSDPTKREAALPLFEKLSQVLQQQPGFKDLQVWTWTARTNHWTVIEVWENEDASHNASKQPEIVRVWDQLYGNAAAPNSLGEYRLLKTTQP
jgi:quinol monooxygenase YgiN